MVCLISSLVRRHLDVLLDIFWAEPAAEAVLGRAIVDADGSSVERAEIVDADEAILGASEEPAAVNDGAWSELVLRRHALLVDTLPVNNRRVFVDLKDHFLSLANRVAQLAHRRWRLWLWN